MLLMLDWYWVICLGFLLELFPSAADKDRGTESIFDLFVLSLGASLVSSWSASISPAVSLEIIACGFPGAISLDKRVYCDMSYLNEERKFTVYFEHRC